MFLEFFSYLRASSSNFVEKHQFNVIFIVLYTNFRQSLVQYHLLGYHVYRLLKYVDFSWKFFVIIICNFVNQHVFKMFMICLSSQNSNFVYSFESLSLNLRHGPGVVHFTVLAPLSYVIVIFTKIA
jgi:hypothetical protein